MIVAVVRVVDEVVAEPEVPTKPIVAERLVAVPWKTGSTGCGVAALSRMCLPSVSAKPDT